MAYEIFLVAGFSSIFAVAAFVFGVAVGSTFATSALSQDSKRKRSEIFQDKI
jgi:hypothetical protein